MKFNLLGALIGACFYILLFDSLATATEAQLPFTSPRTQRADIFAFTQKPKVRFLGNDKFEITFAVKGYCDVTADLVDQKGKVVRHLGAGVLGKNAPAPFQQGTLKQKIFWNGKDDLARYVKEPTKMRVRVMLGLKPVFERRLGGTSPYNIPGYVMGMAIGPDGVCVMSKEYSPGFQHATIRRFGLDGKYIKTILPPPADLPEAKLGGMGFVEYEPGKRAMLGPDLTRSIAHNATYMPPLDSQLVMDCQPALIGNRLIFANTGKARGSPGSFLHYIYTSGATDVRGVKGTRLIKGKFHNSPRLVASPDGKLLYMIAAYARTSSHTHPAPATCVYVVPMDGKNPATVFIGDAKKAGSSPQSFGNAISLDCDASGRLYVADEVNSRLQVFSPEGKLLKSIKSDRPTMVRVHKKTGAIYLQHQVRIRGKSVSRLTKFHSFGEPKELLHVDGLAGWMVLDSWSSKPRLWVATLVPQDRKRRKGHRTGVTIWEDDGKALHKVSDFEALAQKEAGWFKKWHCEGALTGSKSICDPSREKLYFAKTKIFDLATGRFEGTLKHPGSTDDIAFDKLGYMHAHFNPCFFFQGVGRFDPERATMTKNSAGKITSRRYAECPYDYGIKRNNFRGVLPVKDQRGAKGFQDGLGVNMRGEVAVQTNIYYVPKMEDEAAAFALQGSAATTESGLYNEEAHQFNSFLRDIKAAQKRGVQVFTVRRRPGIALSGGTVWTYDNTGELRKECAVIAGDLVNGVQLDEQRSVYFLSARPRVYGSKVFLSAKGGHFGVPKSKEWPFTGTLVKTRPDANCRIMYKGAPVPMEPLPKSPPQLSAVNFPNDARDNAKSFCWIEGAEWLYAGASPIVNVGCSCPASRFHLDWYKRTYVPESYRHSFAVLDANGNLILHVGRYANYDNAPGGPKGCKKGDTDIGILNARYLGGTDNYLCFEDWGERIVVLKLAYHAEEVVRVKLK